MLPPLGVVSGFAEFGPATMVVETDGRPESEDVEDRRLMRDFVAIERDPGGSFQAYARTPSVLCCPGRGCA